MCDCSKNDGTTNVGYKSKMRFFTPLAHKDKWWLTIFYRETGKPNPIRIGSGRLWFGGDLPPGTLAIKQIEVVQEAASIELFPGTIVMAIVASEEPGIDERFKESLSPMDEVELMRPSDIVTAPAELLGDLAKGSSMLQKQIGDRKRFL
jgi:hypothetical protein